MFNFTNNASRTSIKSGTSFGLNSSLPRWGVVFDTNHYAFVYPTEVGE